MLITEFSAGVTTTGAANGAKAAVKALNKKDGIGGSPATLTICDTKNDPNTAADCGQKAVDGKYLAVGRIAVGAGRKVLPDPPSGQHPGGREQRRRPFRLHQPGLVPVERRAHLDDRRALRSALADDGATKISAGYIDVPQGAAIPLFGNQALDSLQPRAPQQGADPRGRARPRELRGGGRRQTAPTASSSRSPARTRSTSSRSYISSGKTGVKFALITTDAAAVLKVIKGQDIDFYGSASYDRRNKQYLADMKAAGYKKTPVGQEIVSYAAVMACGRGGQRLEHRSTGRRSTPSCPRSPTSTSERFSRSSTSRRPGSRSPRRRRVSNVCVKVSKLGKIDFVLAEQGMDRRVHRRDVRDRVADPRLPT